MITKWGELSLYHSFTENFVQANCLQDQGFHSWAFCPGMRFGEGITWWGKVANRPRPHEGIDLYRYVDTVGHCHCLVSGARIPSLFHGTVVDIFPDFLGHSLLMAHDQSRDGWRLYSIIAHVEVEPGIAIGRRYDDGAIIARIAPSKRSSIPAHLHISIVAIWGLPPQPIRWPIIVNSKVIRLLDPGPYLGLFLQSMSGRLA